MTEYEDEGFFEHTAPVDDPDNSKDLTEDVPALALDEIEQFDEKVEQHDEVREGEESDGDESEAAPESKAEADAPVKE